MELDVEVVANTIRTLSKPRFKAICQILLQGHFRIDAIDIDGAGDGGADWVDIPEAAGRRTFVAQDTSQQQDWQNKCRRDAKTAVETYGCTRFLFFTSRAHQSVSFLDLENELTELYNIPVSCLGAVEIAGLLTKKHLVRIAFSSAGLSLEGMEAKGLDRAEALLYGSIALSNEAVELRDTIFDDAIIFYLSECSSASREKIIAGVRLMLQSSEERMMRLTGRIDSLLGRGLLVADKATREVMLAPDTLDAISLARLMYEQQRQDLKSAIELALQKRKKIDLSEKEVDEIAVYVSRYTVLQSVQGSGAANIPIHAIPLIDQFGDPLQELLTILVRKLGNRRVAMPLIQEAVNVSATHPMVIRLFRSVLFFAMDGVSTANHARIFGGQNWSDTQTILDTSVAIPVLCTNLFGASQGRFSAGSMAGFNRVSKLGGKVFIPKPYLNECAVHLIHALAYCSPEIDKELLPHSGNGYVAHYYLQKNAGVEVPQSLGQFLSTISPALKDSRAQYLVSRVMHDIEEHLRSYGIGVVEIERIPESYTTDTRSAYNQGLKTLMTTREEIPMEHDIELLAWMRKQQTEGKYGNVCLTWDRLLISVAKELDNAGWFVTPHQISDLIAAGGKKDEVELLGATHELSMMRAAEDELTARLLDRLVALIRVKKLDWKVLEELKAFRKSLLETATKDGAASEKELMKKEREFLKNHGIDPSRTEARAELTPEEIEEALKST